MAECMYCTRPDVYLLYRSIDPRVNLIRETGRHVEANLLVHRQRISNYRQMIFLARYPCAVMYVS